MQMFPVLLLVVIIAHDAGLKLFEWDGGAKLGTLTLSAAAIAAATWGWMAVILLAAATVFRRTKRHLAGYSAAGSLMRAERIMRWARTSFIAGFAVAVLCLGWLEAVRRVTGELILVDELIAMSPVFVALGAAWWLYYPLEMHVRSAVLIRRLDYGGPIYPMPSRWRYVVQQFRLHVLMLLVPILLILGASQTITMLGERVGGGTWPTWVMELSTMAAAAVVFIFAPYVVRHVLDVRRLPAGQILDDLRSICRAHGVRLRGGLIWQTGGSMINAAVMGLFGPMRYILVTDALLDLMSRDQLKAVFAHEIGHVRRHHMLWMAMCMISALMVASAAVDLGFIALASAGVQSGMMTMQVTALLFALGVTLIVFGWVSRRFERQADTFAVQHLTTTELLPATSDPGHESGSDDKQSEPIERQPRRDVVAPDAVNAMATALYTIARVNGVDPEQSSWRHGSIGWRTRYLRSLVGRPINHLEIDRHVSRIKLAALCMLIASLTYTAWRATHGESIDPGAVARGPAICLAESAAPICGVRSE